jgi:protein phosphatase 1L
MPPGPPRFKYCDFQFKILRVSDLKLIFSGSTLLVAILDGATLWVANVGDSRGVLRNARGEVIPLSFDHKPCQVKL